MPKRGQVDGGTWSVRERHLLGLTGDGVHCASEASNLDNSKHRRKATMNLKSCLQTRCSQRRNDVRNVTITLIQPNLGFHPETTTKLREGKGDGDTPRRRLQGGKWRPRAPSPPAPTSKTFVRIAAHLPRVLGFRPPQLQDQWCSATTRLHLARYSLLFPSITSVTIQRSKLLCICLYQSYTNSGSKRATICIQYFTYCFLLF